MIRFKGWADLAVNLIELFAARGFTAVMSRDVGGLADVSVLVVRNVRGKQKLSPFLLQKVSRDTNIPKISCSVSNTGLRVPFVVSSSKKKRVLVELEHTPFIALCLLTSPWQLHPLRTKDYAFS